MNITPGPWTFEPGDSGDSSVGIGPTPATVTAPVPGATDEVIEICRVSEPAYRVEADHADEFDEGLRYSGDVHANGLLLAAAPDLLAGCEQAMRILTGETEGEWRESQAWEEAPYHFLYEAIAKAKGA